MKECRPSSGSGVLMNKQKRLYRNGVRNEGAHSLADSGQAVNNLNSATGRVSSLAIRVL